MSEQICKELFEKKGFAVLQAGVYLWPKDNIIAEQKTWDDEDECKNFDFTTHNYWITDDSGGDAEGYDSINDALASMDDE